MLVTDKPTYSQVINRRLLLGLIFTIITSCQTIPKTIYEGKGMSFKITEDFKIVETKTWKHNHATYIKIDCRNKDLYANISVSYLPGKHSQDKELQNFTESLKSVYKSDPKNTPEFSEVKFAKFGSNSAKRINYVVANDGPRIGSYTSFHCDNFTVMIGQHYTAESEAMINKCRQLIEETLNCIAKGDK